MAPRVKRSKNLTQEICESKKPGRTYDAKCPGLFYNMTEKGTGTFFVKFWNRLLKKQDQKTIGRYHREHLNVEMARSRARTILGRAGAREDVLKSDRKATADAGKKSKTVEQLIDKYVDFIQVTVEGPPGYHHPRIENWRGYRGFLNRFLRPTLGPMIADEVKHGDIASVLEDVEAGNIGGFKGTKSNARSARERFSGFFTWAIEEGYITNHPCKSLRKMGKKRERTRVLDLKEIREFWHGLDRTDLPFPRGVALALKFELVTMLRSQEFRRADTEELSGLGTSRAHIRVPLNRVKKRRVIVQPLSTLAQEILAEAKRLPGKPGVVFPTVTGIRLHHSVMARALNGWTRKRNGKVTRYKGLCEIIGLKKCVPHDIRRTGASVAMELRKIGGYSKPDIAACLDHDGKGEEVVSPVSNIYMRQGVTPWSQELTDKRLVLETLAEGLREAIGQKPPKLWASLDVEIPPLEPELERLVA